MRQSHIAGERLFVDYAGTTLAVIDGLSGEARTAQLFVAVLGASNYTYAEATWTQGLSDWITYTRFCVHRWRPGDGGVRQSARGHHQSRRSTAPTPRWRPTTTPPLCRRGRIGRGTKPRSKLRCKWQLASCQAAQPAVLLALGIERGHRRAGRADLEQSALKPLPAEPYVFAEWKQCQVGLDYHVEIDKHYYSVPHQLLREKVWARITARTIEVFHRGKRIAAHVRSSSNRKHTTVREQRYADWTPERLRRQADTIGRNTSALVEIICGNVRIPSKASAPASASYGWPRPGAANGLKPPVAGRSRSGRAPTLRSTQSSKTTSIADGLPCPRTGRR
jgi:transposase